MVKELISNYNMRHVFCVHSHTSFMTAISVISFRNLSSENVLFVISRNYTNDYIGRFTSVDVTDIVKEAKLNIRKPSVLRRLVLQVDDLLFNLLSGRDFEAYLPHIGMFIMQVIASNKACKGFHFIEEGVNCYTRNFQVRRLNLSEISKVVYDRLLSRSSRFWNSNFVFHHRLSKDIPIETFAISDEAYAYLPYKHNIINWLDFPCEYKLNQTWPIFIFDAAIEMNVVSRSVFMRGVETMINEQAKEKNYIKFHPNQSLENREEIKNMFRSKQRLFEELPSGTAIESIFIKYNKLDVIGFGSSLLLYAKKTGQNVFSYEKILMSDPAYIKFRKLCDFKI